MISVLVQGEWAPRSQVRFGSVCHCSKKAGLCGSKACKLGRPMSGSPRSAGLGRPARVLRVNDSSKAEPRQAEYLTTGSCRRPEKQKQKNSGATFTAHSVPQAIEMCRQSQAAGSSADARTAMTALESFRVWLVTMVVFSFITCSKATASSVTDVEATASWVERG